MANFDYLKAQIAARIHDNSEQEISAEDVRRSFNDTIDAINAAKEDEGAIAPAQWGGITGTLSAQTDLKDALDGKQAVIADLAAIRSGAAAGATAYQKPSGGIPKTDLNNGVQSSLNKADSAYQKPGTGIPKSDLASGVQTSLGKADTAYQKPNNGIPKSDLAYAVQTSLGKADSAVQPGSLAAVATSGSYNDLTNKPTIPAAPGTLNTNNSTAQSVSSSEALSGTVKLHKVSKTGSYNDLTNKPTIPAAQVQSDWNEADTTKPAYIKNKPSILARNFWYGTCPTAAGSSPKVVTTSSGDFVLATGSVLAVLFSNSNSLSSASLQVDGGTAKSAYPLDGTSNIANRWGGGELVFFVYDGTKFILSDQATASPNAYGITKLNSSTSSTSTSEAATASAVKAAYDHGGVQSVNGSTGAVTLSIPSAPGTLDTTATTAQATNASEALSGSVTLHKVSKTGTYSDLIGTPSLATVATTGDYDDLLNKPTIPAAQVNADWNAGSGVAQILNKPRLAAVATRGDYDDLTGKPTIPSVTLNGSATSSPSFYAPTTAGTNGYVLTSNGSGAPTWQAAPSGGGDVTDVTLGGTSVVDGNGVAVLPAYPVVPTLATVATTGDYDDLIDKPTIPTVPTISTDIDADSSSSTKTASPKAVADYVADSVVGVSAPVPNDGTIIFTHRNGDTDTVDLNHVHSQYVEASDLATVATSGAYADLSGKPDLSVYPKYYLCADEAAYQAIANKDATTLYLIPES